MISGVGSVLAIDLGTSGVKVAVVDPDGKVVASASAPLLTIHLPDGGAEQDAELWWRLIGECARRVVRECEIETVAVTSQYMSIVAIDAAGTPLMNAIMWMDSRGARHHRIAREPGVADLFLERHGMVPLGYDDQGHIAFIREERPEVYAAAAAFVEPVDYVNARLSGRIAATQTTAMPLMTVDNRTHGATAYDDDLVAASRIDPSKLPPLVPYDEILGHVTAAAAAHLGITTAAVVVTGTVDSITSGVGCGVIDDRTCGVIIGTTTVIVTNLDRKAADVDHGLVSVPSPLPNRWFVMAENGVGGRALELWLRIADGTFDDGERDAADVDAGSDGVLFLPWLAGSLAPSSDIRMRGGFLNMGLETTRGHMTRAVYEGVALNAAWLLPHVAAFADAQWDSVRFGGGGASSALWSQILSDATGVAVDQLADPRMANARGAAFLALVQLGHIAVDDIPGMVGVTRTYEPDAGHHDVYVRALEHLVDFHERARPFYAAVNRRR